METLGQVLNYIDELLPNSLNSTTKIQLINNEVKKIWHEMTSVNIYEFETASSQPFYSMPSTNITIDMVTSVKVSDSTEAVTSTHNWTNYEFAGQDDTLTGTMYYDALGNLGIFPTPEDIYPARIWYQESPVVFASTDDEIQFNLDNDYMDLIKFKVMSRIAKSGNYPDVELANNYELDAQELERKMKLRKRKETIKTKSYKYDWRDWR